MPFPNQGIFHPRWEEYVRPTAATQALSVGTLHRVSTVAATFDPATGKTTYPEILIYSGPLRVQILSQQGTESDFAGRKTVLHDARITFPWPGPSSIEAEDVIRVTEDEDEFLLTRKFRVIEPNIGTLMWQRDVRCVVDMSRGNTNG